MTAVVCDECDGWIEVSNRRHPGYCSPACREQARRERDHKASDLAQRRADRRQQAAAHAPVHYLT